MKGIDPGFSCLNCSDRCIGNILSDENLAILDGNKKEQEYDKDEVIIKQGSFVSKTVYIKKGFAKVIIEDKNKRNVIYKIVKEHTFIGLPFIGNQIYYSYKVVAITPVIVCEILHESFKSLIIKNIEACTFYMDWVSKDYLYMFQRYTIMGTRNNHGKLASVLIYLSEGDFSGTEIFKHITRKDLADFANVSLDSVNRILSELKNDKIINTENNNIIILKKELLERLSLVG